MHKQSLSLALVALTATVALTGCTGTTATSQTTVTRTVEASPGAPTRATSPTPSPASCGTSDASVAVQEAVDRLPAPIPSDTAARWDAAHAELSGYSPCAALSWSVVTVVGGTPSSPNAILLFHRGIYEGTATAVQYPFDPQVTRTADDALAVTYSYPIGSDSDADPTGRAHATYTWDAAQDKVVMSGSVPPAS